MGMRTLKIPYPDDLPEALGRTAEELEDELRFLVAARLYETGLVSSGRAAHLAGMGCVEFLDGLGRYGIAVFNYPPEELERLIRCFHSYFRFHASGEGSDRGGSAQRVTVNLRERFCSNRHSPPPLPRRGGRGNATACRAPPGIFI